MPFPTVVARSGGIQAANTSSHPFVLPSGGSDGDLWVVFWSNGNRFTAATLSASGWTRLGATGSMGLWVGVKGTADAAPVVSSSSVRSAHNSWVITDWDGDLSHLGIGFTAVGGSAGAPDPPVCTPPGGALDYLWLACGAETNASGVPTSAPANYSNFVPRTASTGSNSVGIGTAERNLNASSENPGAFSVGTNTNWGACTVAIPYGTATPPTTDDTDAFFPLLF